MTPKIKSTPDLSIASQKHQDAKALGSEHFFLWDRNVADHFKDKTIEQVRQSLKDTAIPLAVCFENWINDFNMATGIRNANAFNVNEVFYIGDKKWDRRGAVGVHNYTEVKWMPTIDDLMALKDRYTFIGVDNVPGAVSMNSFVWPKNTLMIFGEESVGLTPAIQALCKAIVYIPMGGSVRSLNCGTASGIAMHHYQCQLEG